MKKLEITCKMVMDHLCDNLGEDLNSPKCVDIKVHLESCPSCQKFFNTINSTVEFYKKYNVKLDDEGHKKLLSILGLNEEGEVDN